MYQCTSIVKSSRRGEGRCKKAPYFVFIKIVNLKQKNKSFSQYEQYCFKLWELTRWKYRKNQQGVATRRQKRASSMSACTRLLPLQNTAIRRRGLLSLLRNGTYKLHKYIFITIIAYHISQLLETRFALVPSRKPFLALRGMWRLYLILPVPSQRLRSALAWWW